jgi:hypothetical protein
MNFGAATRMPRPIERSTALVLRGQHAEVELETVNADQFPDPPRMPSARDITTMGRDGWIDLLVQLGWPGAVAVGAIMALILGSRGVTP